MSKEASGIHVFGTDVSSFGNHKESIVDSLCKPKSTTMVLRTSSPRECTVNCIVSCVHSICPGEVRPSLAQVPRILSLEVVEHTPSEW